MPARNWLSYTPIGVGLAAVFLLLFAGLINQQKRPQGSDGSATQYAESPQESVAQSSIPSIRGIQTPPPEPTPERKDWREESDLYAQWQMARWAFWMMVASLFSVALTAIGVVFVKQTLDATRAAVAEAENATAAARQSIEVTREIGVKQVRAYLVISDVELMVDTNYGASLRFKYRNTGQSPARNVEVASTLIFRGTMPIQAPIGTAYEEDLAVGETRDRDYPNVTRDRIASDLVRVNLQSSQPCVIALESGPKFMRGGPIGA